MLNDLSRFFLSRNFFKNFSYWKDETKEAFDLMQDVNPSLPAEYILKGIVYALIGQETNNVKIWNLGKSDFVFTFLCWS
jgi:hypothetical protein